MNYVVFDWYPNNANSFKLITLVATLAPILDNAPFVVGQIWPRGK